MNLGVQDCIIRHSNGFPLGETPITTLDEIKAPTQMKFSIIKLAPNQQYHIKQGLESACLLMTGEVEIEGIGAKKRYQRGNIFDEAPIALHLCASDEATIHAVSDCELALIQTQNDTPFVSMIFTEENLLENEHRGEGLLNNTSYRIVRTIFDKRNRPEAELVLGEVINFPGCWSSYPPHHHPQPEIYHYRFTEPQGYGHGELGDAVFKTENYMTVKILDSHVHSQTAAPGYGLYYIWAIKHLPNQPYIVPTFEDAHAWTKNEGANQKVWPGHAVQKKQTVAEVE